MLFSPLALGELELPNRLVMAPLTRVRAGKEGVPGPLIGALPAAGFPWADRQ